MTDKPVLTTISCPNGSFAIFEEDNIISICLIDILGILNTTRIIEAVNKILERDRARHWHYYIYAGPKTLSTPEAEEKFGEFARFRKWLSNMLDRQCKVAVVVDTPTPVLSLAQIERILQAAGIPYQSFNDRNLALKWIHKETA